METVASCPLCGCDQHQPFEEHQDAGRTLSYRICCGCGLVFQSPRMTEDELRAFYVSEYRDVVQGSEAPTEKDLRIQAGRARHLVAFVNGRLPRVQRHLDIGSSGGVLLRMMKRKYGCYSAGVEPGEAYRRFSVERGDVVYATMDDLDQAGERPFDLITMSHVLEHIGDPVSLLRQLRERWLVTGGYLLVEVPNLFGHLGAELSHLTIYSRETLHRTLSMAGFDPRVMKAHGRPRSPILPLYITVLGVERTDDRPPLRRRDAWLPAIRWKRRFAMWINQELTERLPSRTWKPLPEPE